MKQITKQAFKIGDYTVIAHEARYEDNGNFAIELICEAPYKGEPYGTLSVNIGKLDHPYMFVLNHDISQEKAHEILDELADLVGHVDYGFVVDQPVYQLKQKYIDKLEK